MHGIGNPETDNIIFHFIFNFIFFAFLPVRCKDVLCENDILIYKINDNSSGFKKNSDDNN